LAQLLKQMRGTAIDENSLFPGDTTDTLGSIFDMHMSQHLAEHGGFGLAQALENQLPSVGGNTRG
jgi:Rod binding domain-containing protein